MKYRWWVGFFDMQQKLKPSMYDLGHLCPLSIVFGLIIDHPPTVCFVSSCWIIDLRYVPSSCLINFCSF